MDSKECLDSSRNLLVQVQNKKTKEDPFFVVVPVSAISDFISIFPHDGFVMVISSVDTFKVD